MGGALYLDTSVVLRAVLEAGTTPQVEKAIGEADFLVTSLALVESARAMIRARHLARVSEARLADAHPAMGELSLIGITVDLPSGVRARMAVLGPMRMQYERVISAVGQIARTFENL